MTPAYAVAGVLVSLACVGAVLHHELTQARVLAVAEPTRIADDGGDRRSKAFQSDNVTLKYVPLEPRVVRAIPINKQAKAEAAADPAPPTPASEAMAQMRQSKSDKLLPEQEPLSATHLPPHAGLSQPELAASVPRSEPPWPTPTAPSKPPEPPAPPKPSKHASAADEDERPHNVCSKYGGHKVTFMLGHHEMWRCVYPHHHAD
jgi:hypothetical protein